MGEDMRYKCPVRECERPETHDGACGPLTDADMKRYGLDWMGRRNRPDNPNENPDPYLQGLPISIMQGGTVSEPRGETMDREIPPYRRRRGRKPWAIEVRYGRFRPPLDRWLRYQRYETREQAEQALATNHRKRMAGVLYRLIGPDGQIITPDTGGTDD